MILTINILSLLCEFIFIFLAFLIVRKIDKIFALEILSYILLSYFLKIIIQLPFTYLKVDEIPIYLLAFFQLFPILIFIIFNKLIYKLFNHIQNQIAKLNMFWRLVVVLISNIVLIYGLLYYFLKLKGGFN